MGGKGLALIALILVAAVGGGAMVIWQKDQPSPPPAGTLDVAKAPAADESLLAWAENVLAGRCMIAAGFNFTVAAPQTRERDRVDPFDEMYGRTDVAEARRYGFGISPVLRPNEGSVEDPNLPYLRTLPEPESVRFDRALFGDRTKAVRVEVGDGDVSVGTEGCLAEARSTLYGGIAEWAPLDVWATDLDSRAYAEVVGSDEYRAVLSRWRECMRGLGHRDADPAAVRSRIAEQVDEAGAVAAERDAAVADADCNGRSGLRRTAEARHRSAVDKIVAADRVKLADWRDRRDQALRTAHELAASY